MPGINGSDRIKIIAFEFGGNTYLYEAGRLLYTPIEDLRTWQTADKINAFNWSHLHLQFLVFAGYLDQQLNAGNNYTLADATVISSAPAAGAIDILNALKDANATEIFFYPALEDEFGINDDTKYSVHPRPTGNALIDAERAGRFTPYTPIQFITKDPLDDYPAWANR